MLKVNIRKEDMTNDWYSYIQDHIRPPTAQGDPELSFFAVYDGHGGTGVANYLKDHLHEFILSQEVNTVTTSPQSVQTQHGSGQEYREGDIPEAILKSFLAVDSELKSYGNATELTGSTGMMVI